MQMAERFELASAFTFIDIFGASISGGRRRVTRLEGKRLRALTWHTGRLRDCLFFALRSARAASSGALATGNGDRTIITLQYSTYFRRLGPAAARRLCEKAQKAL